MIAFAKEETRREKRTRASLEMDIQEARRSVGRKEEALMELREAAAALEAEKVKVENSLKSSRRNGGGQSGRRFPGEWLEL